jgi:hypothetical protein
MEITNLTINNYQLFFHYRMALLSYLNTLCTFVLWSGTLVIHIHSGGASKKILGGPTGQAKLEDKKLQF